VSSVVNVCAQCHVREGELFSASPKKPLFEATGQKDCLVCHGNHRILHPQDAWIGLEEPAVCATCHDKTTGGADVILAVRQRFDALNERVRSAGALLDRAERAGMLVDEGRTAMEEANEHRIHARVTVHAFALRPFDDMTKEALASVAHAERVGDEAMTELAYRRRGLIIATALILGFLVTLGWKIRDLSRSSGRS
jgi:predicted CXXCH cytochrome family protein